MESTAIRLTPDCTIWRNDYYRSCRPWPAVPVVESGFSRKMVGGDRIWTADLRGLHQASVAPPEARARRIRSSSRSALHRRLLCGRRRRTGRRALHSRRRPSCHRDRRPPHLYSMRVRSNSTHRLGKSVGSRTSTYSAKTSIHRSENRRTNVWVGRSRRLRGECKGGGDRLAVIHMLASVVAKSP